MIELETFECPIDQILIGDRARKSEVSDTRLEELAASISEHGLIHAILVELQEPLEELNGYHLVAGYNRIQAFSRLGLTHIPARLCTDADPDEVLAIELVENLQRSDMTWQDQARATVRLHDLKPDQTLEKTCQLLGITSTASLSKILTVGRALDGPNAERLSLASGITAAYNSIGRDTDRAIAVEMETMLAPNTQIELDFGAIERTTVENLFEEKSFHLESDSGVQVTNVPKPAAPSFSILQTDFVQWIRDYKGPKFNFLHCDFPYGIGWDKARKGQATVDVKAEINQYEDSWSTYVTLIASLTEHWPRIMLPSSHLLFWLSADHDIRVETRNMLEGGLAAHGINLEFDSFDLMWHKSDGKGIIPNPSRQGRRTYEVALFGSTGERPIVKPVEISYACPTAGQDRLHVSEKPESMLRHFFSLTVDATTRVLDPTCGSGTSIRAALHHRAAFGLGLELNSETAITAQRELDRAITLQSLST